MANTALLVLSVFFTAIYSSDVRAVQGTTTAPLILYTDCLSGPTSGGENNLGAYLSIFGKNFGNAAGLGTKTKVYIGGTEVANYRLLVNSVVSAKLGIQQITVQVGSLGGAALGTALSVVVALNGVKSNADNMFTPAAGNVLFLSLTGNDATATANDINKPWRNFQYAAKYIGAYFSCKTGDHIVIRGGDWSDTNGIDSTWMKFSVDPYNRNGNVNSWIHITAYPGEDVHYTCPAGASGGIQGPWTAIAGTSGEYISISNLRMEVSAGASRDAGPLNFQMTSGPWRVVNNELGPWVAGKSAVLNCAALSGHGKGNRIYGNHLHDIEGLSDLQNHGIYADTTASDWDIAYNYIHDMVGGSLIQFNDNEGGAGSYLLPHGGVWPGFTDIRVHHNWLENSAKYGINFNDEDSAKIGVYSGYIYNNVIIGTDLPPFRISSTQPAQQLYFAYNTIYDCMQTNSFSGNAYVRAESWSSMAGVGSKFYNNIFAFGPNTIAGTQWFVDGGALPASIYNYDFKRNLYFSSTQSPNKPSTIGDKLAIIGDPLFSNAASGDFTTKATSPARDAASQQLPSGFYVNDDFTSIIFRPTLGSDIGAYTT